MATRNIVFGSGNGNKEIDLIDVAALILLPGAASMIFGVFSFQVDVFGGYDFTAALWTIGGMDISLALLLAVFSVAWIAGTNLLNEQTDMGPYEAGLTITALLLPVLFQFVPAVESLIMWHGITQVGAWMYVSAAAVVVSYIG